MGRRKKEDSAAPEPSVEFDIEAFKKQWGVKVKEGTDFKDDDLLSISTGSVKLDWALNRPFLEGSMVEIYGPQTAGKTTLALNVAKHAIKMGKRVFYLDLEYKLRESQLNMISGLDKSKITLIFPDNGEEALNIMHDIMISCPGCVIILDSVGGLLPEAEDAEGFNRSGMGEVARLCHKLVRKLTGINSRNKCVTIFLNHLTATMNPYGGATTTHGGNAIKNRAAQRIELKTLAAGAMKDTKTGEQYGQKVKATVVKNNVNRPFVTIEFPLVYGKGIDEDLDLLEFAVDVGVIGSYSGGWYTIPGGDKKFREAELVKMLKEDAEFRAIINGMIKELI